MEAFSSATESEGRQLLLGSVTWEDSRGCLGVTWSVTRCYLGVTWCYLECYLVLPRPGRYLGCYFGKSFFLWSQISAFLKLKLLKKSPGNVTWSRACPCYLVAWPTLSTGCNYDSNSNHENLTSARYPNLISHICKLCLITMSSV